MSDLPTDLLENLIASRFLVEHAKASVGVGERRSEAKGAGLEFAVHRAYQHGDDARRIDPRLYARLGEPYIRLFSEDRQLPVTVLLDASPSMRFGTPDKFDFARKVCQVLGFIALRGGDRIRAGIVHDGGVSWSRVYASGSQLDSYFAWFDQRDIGGPAPFGAGLGAAFEDIHHGGLVFLISDLWDEDCSTALDRLVEGGSEIVGIHVAAPEEIDPADTESGLLRMVDAESGEEIEVMCDTSTIAQYREAFSARSEELRQIFRQRQARYFFVNTATTLRDFFLRDLRNSGLVS